MSTLTGKFSNLDKFCHPTDPKNSTKRILSYEIHMKATEIVEFNLFLKKVNVAS